jgi:hypothetical protein
MAVQTYAAVPLPQVTDSLGVGVVTWGGAATGAGSTPLAHSDTGTPISLPQKSDMSFQATGTFGAGGSVAIEVSNDGTNFFVAKDPNGTAIALTAAAPIARLTGPWLWVRPNATGGDGTTAVVVDGCFRTVKAG